jgi:hypothetical protein
LKATSWGWGALVVLFLARNDLWWWDRSVDWMGLPASLVLHVGFGLAVTAALVPLARSVGETNDDGEA